MEPQSSEMPTPHRRSPSDALAATKESSITELLDRCSKRPGDEDAWQEFVRRFHLVIKSNVIRTCRRKSRDCSSSKLKFNSDQIEDLVQTVYLRLIEGHNRALINFNGEFENSFYQYLSMISINVVLDYFREAQAQKRPRVVFSLDDFIEESGEGSIEQSSTNRIGASSESNEAALIARDAIEAALRRAVTGNNRNRDVLIFKLRHYDGLSHEEIKKALNLEISVISIGSILNRITARLRKLLDPKKERH